MINKISRKRSPTETKHLQAGKKEVTTVADIVDTRNRFLKSLLTNIIHQNFNLTKPILNVKILNLTLIIWRHITFLSA